MAEKKVRGGHVVDDLLSNIDPRLPFFHVADNNDLNEETLDGRNTTHCTNTIVVQRDASATASASAASALSTQPARKRKRALQIDEEALPDLVAQQKVNPARQARVDLLEWERGFSSTDDISLIDFTWFLAGACRNGDVLCPVLTMSEDTEEQSILGWTSFNALSSRSIPARSAIGYCPVVNASPTELSTVYAILTKCLQRCQNAGMPFTLIVLDQAVYAKALDIVSQRPDEFSPVVLRLGSSHISCMFLAVKGKRFRDAGLLDTLMESGVAGPASASSALDGGQYNRGVRYHKVVAEALERLRWKAFVDTTGEDQLADFRTSLSPAFSEVQSCITSDNVSVLKSSPELLNLAKKYRKFCQEQGEVSQSFSFWSSYIEMVSLLLRFIRASRIADWKLHLQCVFRMAPWCFAYERQNYTRFMSFYWVQMVQLAATHPAAHAFLQEGGFSVQGSENSFAQVASDQAIEQSINRATKTTGGIVSFSRHLATVQRWILTSHDRAAVTDLCLEHCGLDDVSEGRDAFHKECHISRLSRDEKDVISVIDFTSKLFCPFALAGQPYPQLVHLTSGVEALPDVAKDLLKAEEVGRNSFYDFVKERLTTGRSSTPTKEFHDPISKLNLKSFTVRQSKKSANNPKDILRSDRWTFSRIALLAQTRQMNMREVLSHPLGPLPWVLATTFGTLVKTAKSTLLPLLTDGIPDADQPAAANGALLVDAMALARSFTVTNLLQQWESSLRIHSTTYVATFLATAEFVADRYQDISIKNLEMSARAADGALRQHITGPGQHMPRQFSKFLAVGTNKEELLSFLMLQWQQPSFMAKIPDRKVLVITSGSSCVMINSESGVTTANPVVSLECTHEEADTRLLLHAFHAASSGSPTVTYTITHGTEGMICHNARLVPCVIVFRTWYTPECRRKHCTPAQLCRPTPNTNNLSSVSVVNKLASVVGTLFCCCNDYLACRLQKFWQPKPLTCRPTDKR